jgi:hypothetical protein
MASRQGSCQTSGSGRTRGEVAAFWGEPVLEVDDVADERDRVVAAGWSLEMTFRIVPGA